MTAARERARAWQPWTLRIVREPAAEYSADARPGAVRTSAEAVALLRPLFAGLDRETCVALLLDVRTRPLGINVVSVGSLTASLVHPREVFKPALLAGAVGLIVAHNHPSGDPTPSREDVAITRRLAEAGTILGVALLDALVLGDGDRYVSFADAGTLPGGGS